MITLKDPGRVVILGCGPTGLGAAWRLEELGHHDYQILEGSDRPGGLAASVVDERGFTWDLGGHVQFSHYCYYNRILDEVVTEVWLWHERESWVWIKDRFVPYPFQYNIHRLDREDTKAILADLENIHAKRRTAHEPRDFREWILETFGKSLAELFMLPYNFKVWAYPLNQLDWTWIGERVAVPELGRIQSNIARNRDDVSWGPNNRFRFPLHGGTGAIWQAVASRIKTKRVVYRDKAIAVSTTGRKVATASGREIHYDTLISSIPLDYLIRMTDGLPLAVRRASKRLIHSSIYIVGIGLKGGKPESLDKKCWMYFPEGHSPHYRVTVFSHYSPNNVPAGEGIWSLMTEVSESRYKKVNEGDLREWTISSLRKDKLIESDGCVLSFWKRRLEYGYPTPFLGRENVLSVIQSQLEKRRIYSRGRFGGWKYEVSNQDHSFMQGVEVVNRLTKGDPETTYEDPITANSGVFLKEQELAVPHSDDIVERACASSERLSK